MSGFVGAIIIALVTSYIKIAKMNGSLLRIQISLEEKEFASPFTKFSRAILIFCSVCFFCSVYSLFVVYGLLNSTNITIRNSMFSLFNSFSTLLLIGLVIFVFMEMLYFKNVQKRLSVLLHKKKRTTKKKLMGFKSSLQRRQVFIIIMFLIATLYFLIYFLVYGMIVSTFLMNKVQDLQADPNDIFNNFFLLLEATPSEALSLCVTTVIYTFLLLRLLNLFRFLGHFELSVDIVMNDGSLFLDKRLVHQSLEEGYLIADSKDLYDLEKILIPKKSINFIKFRYKYYSLGREVIMEKSTLITEDQYTEKDKDFINSMKRNY